MDLIQELFNKRRLPSFDETDYLFLYSLCDTIGEEYVCDSNESENTLSYHLINELKSNDISHMIDPVNDSIEVDDHELHLDNAYILKGNHTKQPITHTINVDEEIDILLQHKQLNWKRCYIVGGSLANLTKNIFYEYTPLDEASDVDIIVVYNKSECAESVLRREVKSFTDDRCIVSRHPDHLTFNVMLNNRCYQFFTVQEDYLFKFIFHFHFTCCRAIYNKSIGLRVTRMCYLSNKHMINYWIDDHFYEKRCIKKYVNRGYTFILNRSEYEEYVKSDF